MKEFFGFGGYQREPEGYFSWQHILFVSILMIIMFTLAILFGRRNRELTDDKKKKVLVVSAILIDSLELIKIIILCFRSGSLETCLYGLPLFLCSIQLITIPLAAFSKGRVREAALDFVLIFGLLGAILGTYLAGNNYSSYPVLSFDNVISGITHCISGFSALYIGISKMCSMKKENIIITNLILLSFCIVAYIVNHLVDYNYMFLVRGDGTPYDIIYNLVNGNQIVYPIIVIALFFGYITLFYYVYYLILKQVRKKNVLD